MGKAPDTKRADDQQIVDTVADNLFFLYFIYFRYVFRNEHGITWLHAAQYRLLGYLMSGESVPMSVLARALYIPMPHMTKLVDTLIDKGLVNRMDDPQDRRVIRVNITREGMDYHESARILYNNSVREYISGLDRNDLAIMSESTKELMEILSGME